jgi:hypothetical protein
LFISAKEIECHNKKNTTSGRRFYDETPVFVGVLNGSLW